MTQTLAQTAADPAVGIEYGDNRQITLTLLGEDGVEPLGTFDSPAAAWAALDAIDAPAA